MIGIKLNRYTIVSELGTGGMGKVYLAVTPSGQRVALKVVHPHLVNTPGFFKRFLREGEIGRKVKHENVVRTVDVDAITIDDKQVPLYRILWVATVPHFCGEADCQHEGHYEVRLEPGDSVWAASTEQREEVVAALEKWQGGLGSTDDDWHA